MGPEMKHLQVVIFTLILKIPLFASQDAASFFVVTKNHCITNRTSAIVFNPDVGDANDEILSRFYPPRNNKYDCNIEEGEGCTDNYKSTNWKLQNSINGDIDEEIIDRRWEEFKVHKSSYLDRDGTSLVYTEAPISITKDDFVIPLSLRLKNEGHVFLCEDFVTNSNCYWIMLQAWAGQTSAIRRCEANSIPNKNNKWPQGSCKILRTDFSHTEDIISDKFWTHLKIIKKGDTIAVKIRDRELLTFTDDEPFSPRRVFFHSKNNEGLWKFHQYTYTYTDKEDNLQLGPIFEFQKGFNCLALFAVMCEQCVLEIELVNANQTVHKERFATSDEKWKEFKIISNSSYDQTLWLYYNTIFQDGRSPTKKFWAIDSIRQCESNEYRILESRADNVPCQFVAGNDIFTVDNSGEVSDPNTDCSEHTFGENCLPCNLLARQYECSSLKYCEVINNRRSCHCTAGFRTDTCSEECPQKYYGQGCKKQCKYCSRGCNNIDGICIHGLCSKGFSGNKCDIPPAPLLKYPPEVTDIKPTSCTVFIKEFDIIGDGNSVQYFRFEHKKSTDTQWIPGEGKSLSYWRDEKESITNLEADTEYCVRAVLYQYRANIHSGDAIEEKCFNTTCVEYTKWDIQITPYNDSAEVTLNSVTKMNCQLKNYRYSLDTEAERDMAETVHLNNLKPAKSYKFNLRRIGSKTISKEFRTKEGIPSKVESLKNVKASSNEISIAWKEPKEPNGNVTYIVQYRLFRKKDCHVTTNNFSGTRTLSTYTSISALKPYSVYEIRVTAQTSEAVGPYESIHVETAKSDTLSNSESSLIDKIIPSNYTLKVVFKPIKCEDVEGPIYLKFVAVCQNWWCRSQEHNHVIITYNISLASYTVRNLTAYTNYKLTVAASRDTMDWSTVQTTNFTTESSDPNKVDAVIVTSKDERSISLRWKPPFPPTGILTQYKIKYNKNEMESDIIPCRLWKDYHCVTITKNIKEKKKYKIQLYARNEGHDTYGSILNGFLEVTAQTEAPDPPYDFMGVWTDQNDLNVSWKHPNKTNGKVTKFTVDIADGGSKSLPVEIGSEENYNLTYTYTIEKKIFTPNPCRELDVSVTVYNEKYSSKSKVIKVFSPPAVPNISNSDIQITNDTNQNVFIILPTITGKSSQNENNTYYILSTSSRDEGAIRNELKRFEEAVKKGSEPPFTYFKKHDSGSQENLSAEKKITINSTHHNNIYRLYIYFVNSCRGKVELQMVERNPFSLEPIDGNKAIYALILLIFLIPLVVYVYVYKIKKKQVAEGGIMSVIKPQRKKDIEEVPLSDNDPVKVSPTKPQPKQKVMLHTPASHIVKTKFSKPIKIIDFEMYVKRAIETGEMEKQHEKFPRGQTKPWDYGALKVNKSKNRYNNLIAYDHTRVKLAKINGVEYSDYVNANYIDGYRIPKAYIATQGPKATTLDDFWRMVWQENVEHIVMLANIYEGGKKKVEKYWPSINEEMDFNGICVQYLSSRVYANYEHRVFKVHNKTEEREVNQLHFTSWPDHGVPLYSQSLVPFLQQILKIPNNPQSPVVVHCSAGVGRTGTIILCDICLRMAAGEGSIDFLANLEHLRSQRPNMVDNVEQYKLAHLVVLECLFGMHTSIACDDSMAKAIENLLMGDGIQNQLRYLSDTEWEDRAMDTIWNKEDVTICPEKNRYKDILPDKNYRICLKYYPQNDELSSYINAVQVDGFRSPGRFIVSQQPLPNTVGDFWRMVWERQCTVIINLNEIDPNDQSSCSFWPEKKGPDMTPVEYLQVSFVRTKVLEAYRITTVEVVNKKESESMEVNIIAMHNWMPNVLLPNSIENFLLFWEECDISSRKCETIIVTCHDGATASGLYIATTFLIDKIKLEQECDVCLAVRTIRHNRKQFITSEEQFTFLYKVALMYIQSFQSYANFA